MKEPDEVFRWRPEVHRLHQASGQARVDLLLSVDPRELEGQGRIDVGQRLRDQGKVPCRVLEVDRPDPFHLQVDGRPELGIQIGGDVLAEPRAIRLILHHGGPVGLNLRLEPFQRTVRLIAMLPIRTPLFRGEADEDTGTDQDDLEECLPHERAARIARGHDAAILTAD